MHSIRHFFIMMVPVLVCCGPVKAAPITNISAEVNEYIQVATQMAAFVSTGDTNGVESVSTNFFDLEASLFTALDAALDRIQGYAAESGATSTNLLPITEELLDATATTRNIGPQIGFWLVQTDSPTQSNLLAMIEEAVTDLQEARDDVDAVLVSIAAVIIPPVLGLRLIAPDETVKGDSIPIAAEMTNTGDTTAENIRLIGTYGYYPDQEEQVIELGDLPAGQKLNHLLFVPAPMTSNSALMVSVTLEADNATAALDTVYVYMNEP